MVPTPNTQSAADIIGTSPVCPSLVQSSLVYIVSIGRKRSPTRERSLPSTGQKVARSVTPPTSHSPEIMVDSPGEEKVEKKPNVLPPSTKTSFELFRKQALENAERVSPLV